MSIGFLYEFYKISYWIPIGFPLEFMVFRLDFHWIPIGFPWKWNRKKKLPKKNSVHENSVTNDYFILLLPSKPLIGDEDLHSMPTNESYMLTTPAPQRWSTSAIIKTLNLWTEWSAHTSTKTKYEATMLSCQSVPPYQPQLCFLPLLGYPQSLFICGLLRGRYVFRDLSCSLRHLLVFDPDPLARIGKR